jgi:hypothetical protein
MSPSNEYQLNDFNSEARPPQRICFYEKEEDGTELPGTTLEDMLLVSIARLKSLNNRFACRENSLAITKMEEALMWLNARTADRVARGVEGKHVV